MSLLAELKGVPGARRKAKRLGRGIGSGKGGTSGKGNKGQKARSGGKVRRGFEGGQMPMYRRMPKVGFVNENRIEFSVVNIGQLAKLGSEVSPELLKAAGLVKGACPVKILGKGQLTAKVKVRAHKFSQAAKAAIEKAGGSAEEIK